MYHLETKKPLKVVPIDAMNSEVLVYRSSGNQDAFEKIAKGDLLDRTNAVIQMQLESSLDIEGSIPRLTFSKFEFETRY